MVFSKLFTKQSYELTNIMLTLNRMYSQVLANAGNQGSDRDTTLKLHPPTIPPRFGGVTLMVSEHWFVAN